MPCTTLHEAFARQTLSKAGGGGYPHPVHTDDFDFELPAQLIAQRPLAERDSSRLLHVDRANGRWHHRSFRSLPSLLRGGDVVVLNDSKVIPARLIGHKRDTGGRAELLLVRPVPEVETHVALRQEAVAAEWVCLGQSSKGFRTGMRLCFGAELEAAVCEDNGGGEYRVRFSSPLSTLEEALARAGQTPLPPYIERQPSLDDEERYQTVYAATAGSIAAPTAGLHFTPALLQQLKDQGVQLCAVTLEVGPGTFLPVRSGLVEHHHMHEERCSISEAAADQVNEAKREGRRIVAIGTTVVRALESSCDEVGRVAAGRRSTRLFITPGFRFRVVDALLTNFHLPKSTLLMLVSAFLGRQRTLTAYAEAVREGYRFFSYGDAMFIDDESAP